MGFYLWLDEDSAWAQGTYEYRPMGAAVIALSDLFRRQDFHPCRKPRPGAGAEFAGQFASLGHINQQLEERRKPHNEPVSRASGPRKPSPTR
jgi:hypothetical protein